MRRIKVRRKKRYSFLKIVSLYFFLNLFCKGEKIATNLEQECSMVSRGENHRDAEKTKLNREVWYGIW